MDLNFDIFGFLHDIKKNFWKNKSKLEGKNFDFLSKTLFLDCIKLRKDKILYEWNII
jgi:hypothetical protein